MRAVVRRGWLLVVYVDVAGNVVQDPSVRPDARLLARTRKQRRAI